MSISHEEHPAFPYAPSKELKGMKLRDWFAGQALTNLPKLCLKDSPFIGGSFHSHVANSAYQIADEMMKARMNNQTK